MVNTVISGTQMPKGLRDIVDEQLERYNSARSIQNYTSIPGTTAIPLDNQTHWLKIADVICVFVDMKGSTQLSASTHDKSTAGAYQLFTGTAVRLFHAFEAPYIDVRGDGVFALFNQDQVYRAVAAAVSFKTFAQEVFVPIIRERTDLEIGAHIGIDQRTVLVRRIGLRSHAARTDRQNEVWAGKPVNMASKLAAMGEVNELRVSDRYFERIRDDLVRKSCGCPSGEKKDLWTEVEIAADPKFDFDKVYVLKSYWCKWHGDEYCRAILELDDQ